MTVYTEVARILAEELPPGTARVHLDLGRCTPICLDHLDPEELCGEDPDGVIAMLDHHDVMVQVQAARDVDDLAPS